MKVAIFGASGLVGRSLIQCFDSQNIEWVGTFRSSSFPGGYHFDSIDPTNIQAFLMEHNVTACINCVAERNVDYCEKHWESTLQTNCKFAGNLAAVSKSLNIFFLHISTDYVFDGNHSPYYPSSVPNPIQAYGKSKYMAEKEVISKNDQTCIVRVPVLYTQRINNINETAVTMIGKKVFDRTKHHKEDNFYIRRPVFIDDFAHFLLDRLQKANAGIYHFYNPEDAITKYQMASLIASYLNKDFSHITPQENQVLDASRPYDTNLRDDQYDRGLFPATRIYNGIPLCFKKFKHPRFELAKAPKESIFFLIDLDGTLLDTFSLHYECYKKAYEAFDYKLCDWNEFSTLSSFEKLARTQLGNDYDKVKELKNSFFFSTYVINFKPGAEQFLKWLLETQQNFAVVTNTTQETVSYLISRLPILSRIQQWIVRSDVSKPKPHPEPYALAKERFWKGEPYIIGFEDTPDGYESLRHTTSIIYIMCENESSIYKKLSSKDVFLFSDYESIMT